jgi:hypothetical protein
VFLDTSHTNQFANTNFVISTSNTLAAATALKLDITGTNSLLASATTNELADTNFVISTSNTLAAATALKLDSTGTNSLLASAKTNVFLDTGHGMTNGQPTMLIATNAGGTAITSRVWEAGVGTSGGLSSTWSNDTVNLRLVRTLDIVPSVVTTNGHDTSQIGSGIMNTARLGSNTASSSVYLRGDSAWSALPWIIVKKTTNQIAVSNATMSPDSELSFAMAANTAYQIRGTVFFNTGANSDYKYAFTGPASPTVVAIYEEWVAPAATALNPVFDTTLTATNIALGSSSATGLLRFVGVVHNAGNTGTFQFNWAQNTSGIQTTTVYKSSYIEYGTSP